MAANGTKRVHRTEAQEMAPVLVGPIGIAVGDPVWFFERSNGHAYEHLARVEKIIDATHLDLSWSVVGETGRFEATAVPSLASGSLTGGWARAR